MKKALLSIATVLAFAEGQAQITLGDTSYPSPIITTATDSFMYIASGYSTGNPDKDVYSAHTNHLWNLNTLAFANSNVPKRWVKHVAATGYTYANQVADVVNFKTLPGTQTQYRFLGQYLTNKSAAGLIEHGFKFPVDSTYSLSTLTNAVSTDTLKIPAQTAMYYSTTIGGQLTTRTKLKFPATYMVSNISWTNLYQDTLHGTMTYAFGGLIDTPFHRKSEVTEGKTIIGWGKMRLNKPVGMLPLVSDTFNVLQVRCSTQIKDFYYTGTANLSTTILNQMGVASQGGFRVAYYDEYYRRDNVEPILTVRFTDATYSLSDPNTSDMHLRGLNPTDVAILTNMANINVYPNPVKGGIVNVDINGVNGNWNYTLVNINGQVLKSGVVKEGNNKVELPSNMPAGNYYMSLENASEKVVKSIVIAE